MIGLVIVVLSTFLSLFTGLAVLIRNIKQSTGILYGFASLTYISLGIVNFLSTRTTGDEKLMYARLVMVFTSIAVALTLYLIIGLTDIRARVVSGTMRKLVLYLGGGLFTLVVGAISSTDLVIKEVKGEIPIFGPGMAIFVPHMLLFSASAIWRLLVVIRKKTGAERAQASYLLAGYLPVLLVAPFTGVYLPMVNGDLTFISLTPAYSAIFVVMVGYAMVRHQLFGVQFYVIRFTTFIFSQLFLSIVYVVPIFYLALKLAHINLSWWQFVLGAALLTLAAIFYDSVQRRFRSITNKIFFQDAYDPSQLLAEVNQKLVSAVDLEKILNGVKELIDSQIRPVSSFFVLHQGKGMEYTVFGSASNVKVENVVPFLRNMDKSRSDSIFIGALDQKSVLRRDMKRDDIAIILRIPIYSEPERLATAFLVVGPRKSGNAYTPQDFSALNAIVNALTIALQNVFRFEEVKKFNVTLQAMVDEATRKLRKSNERLRLLDQTKDDFISMASHQLRTPLTSVKGYVSMVLDGDAGPINETQRKLLTQAFLSSQRMVYLISDLLNVSRLKTGKFIIEPVESRLDKVIEEELEQLTETIKSRGLTLEYHKPERFPTLMLDETKIRQVIMNFVDNATYYTPSGGSIDVYLEDKGKSVEFRVVDTGIGVPRHEQHHLFTKFYRAKNAKNARPDGTGLGIFMAKKVIIAQGGAVIFRSTEGKGSTFGFTFPKAKLLPPLKLESKQPASKEAQPA